MLSHIHISGADPGCFAGGGGGGGEGGIKKINLARKQKGSNFPADQASKKQITNA